MIFFEIVRKCIFAAHPGLITKVMFEVHHVDGDDVDGDEWDMVVYAFKGKGMDIECTCTRHRFQVMNYSLQEEIVRELNKSIYTNLY